MDGGSDQSLQRAARSERAHDCQLAARTTTCCGGCRRCDRTTGEAPRRRGVFVRNRDFSAIVEKVVPTVESAPGWKGTEGAIGETSFRFVFGHRDDANREIILTVLLLAVPSPDSLPPQES